MSIVSVSVKRIQSSKIPSATLKEILEKISTIFHYQIGGKIISLTLIEYKANYGK